MKKRNVLILVLAFALVLPGCGGKVRQSQAGGSSKAGSTSAESSTQSAESSKSSKSSEGSKNSTESNKSLAERFAETKPEKPTRPGTVWTPDIQPVHLEGHDNISDSKLPKVEITLPDDYKLSKSDYTEGKLSISNAGDNNLPASSVKVRIRGNSTAEAEKRPLKIKFDSKQGLFGREPEKSWTLISNCFDMSGIHNYVSYGLYDKLTPDGSFSTLCEFVDVYVNGAYQGVYNLCDQVETGKGRVPIKASVGSTPDKSDYLIEQDFRAPTEDPDKEDLEWFWMTWYNAAFKVQSPEEKDGLTKEHTAYIKGYLDDVYAAIKLKDWDAINDLIDVDSFIIGQAVSEITKNYDISQASLFLYKKSNGKLTFGPAWDFDTTFGSCPQGTEGVPEGYATERSPLFGGLMEVPEYKKQYIAYFKEHLDEMVSFINSTIDNVDKTYGANLENDYKNWGERYKHYGVPEMQTLKSHAEQTAYMKQWLSKRAEWLSNNYK